MSEDTAQETEDQRTAAQIRNAAGASAGKDFAKAAEQATTPPGGALAPQGIDWNGMFQEVGNWLDILFSIFMHPEDVKYKMISYGYRDTDEAPQKEEWMTEDLQEPADRTGHTHAQKKSGNALDEASEKMRCENKKAFEPRGRGERDPNDPAPEPDPDTPPVPTRGPRL